MRGLREERRIFNLDKHRVTNAGRRDSGIPATAASKRLKAHGKAIFQGDRKIHIRGVTYGTFRPDDEGSDFPAVEAVAEDFAEMAAHGVNSVRTYTVPPRWLLDLALEHGLWVMVGIPWEQHIAFLNDRGRAAAI